jgi:hypothetical protein
MHIERCGAALWSCRRFLLAAQYAQDVTRKVFIRGFPVGRANRVIDGIPLALSFADCRDTQGKGSRLKILRMVRMIRLGVDGIFVFHCQDDGQILSEL